MENNKSQNKKSKSKSRIQIIIVIFVSIIAVTIGVLLRTQPTIETTEASASPPSILSYKPELIIAGETESVLLTGINFKENCELNIGEEKLSYKFVNTESIEVDLPADIEENSVIIKCPEGTDSIELNIDLRLDTLP